MCSAVKFQHKIIKTSIVFLTKNIYLILPKYFILPDKRSVAENWGTHEAVAAVVGALVVVEAVEAGKAAAA